MVGPGYCLEMTIAMVGGTMPKSKVFDKNYGIRIAVNKQEKRLAKSLGGRRVPGSGGMRRTKWTTMGSGGGYADAISPSSMAEAKLTIKSHLTIKWAWLSAITKKSLLSNRTPVVMISSESHNTMGIVPKDWALLPWDDYVKVERYLHPTTDVTPPRG